MNPMQRPNSSRLYGLLMITALFVAVFALVTALGAPAAGAQANRADRTRTAEPHETEHPRETETPHAEHTGTAEPHETEHPRETETPHAERTGTAEPHETEHPRETETPHAEHTGTATPHETEHPRETGTPRPTTTTVPATVPGSTARTFPQTGKAVNGLFLTYWDDRGALAQQGYPISPVMEERSDLNGQTYAVQYFERAVFEYHPENQAPFNVLLSQLGTFQYRARYGTTGAPGQQATQANGRYFPETRHWVGGKFRSYWEQHGGLAQQGYPISDEFTEVSPLDGKPYRVQYFERAVFELHPENQAPFDVLLSQLGTFQYQQKYGK
jgi:hypothetical protein